MEHYQFFYSDAAGDVVRTGEFQCDSGATAMALMARTMGGAASAEVWCGARLIGEDDAWTTSAIGAIAAMARPIEAPASTVLDAFHRVWDRGQRFPA